jgi:rhodanese-related sulfurtransferase
LLDPDVPTVLIAEDEPQALRAARRLQAIGHLIQRGWILASDAHGTTVLQPLTIEEFLEERDTLQIIDVRADDELPAPLAGAIQIPITSLHDASLAALDPTRRTAVICQSSQRAGIGAAVLARRGFSDVHPVLGAGMGSPLFASVS